MSYAERLVKGGLAVFSMYFISGILSTLLRIYLARSLTVEEFGLLYAVLSFFGVLLFIKDFGLSATLTRYISQFKARNDKESVNSVTSSVISLQLILAGILSGAVLIFMPYLSSSYFKYPNSEQVIIPIMLSYVASVFVSLQYVLQGMGKIAFYSMVEPARNLITLALAFLLIGFGVAGVSYAYLAGTILLSVLLFLLLKRLFPFFRLRLMRIDRKLMPEVVRFSRPLFVTTLAGNMLNYVDTILITAFLSVSSVALYQIALPTSQILWVLIGSISIVVLPLVTELWTKNDRKTISRVLGLLIKFVFIFSMPFIIPAVAFPEIIIRMLFGDQYLAASAALQILVINSAFYASFWILSTAVIGIGEPKANRNIVLILGGTNLFLNLLLIRFFGIEGAAVAALVSYLIGTLVIVRYLSRKSLIRVPVEDIVKAMFGAAISFIAIVAVKTALDMHAWIEAGIAVSLGTALYAAFLYLSGTVRKEELLLLRKGGIPIPERIIRIFK